MLTWVAEHPEAAIAVVAVVVSLVSSVVFFVRQTALQERVTRIEEERRDEERRSQQRADVTVDCSVRDSSAEAFVRSGNLSLVPPSDLRMILHNRGPAVARNVNMRYELLDGDQTLPGILDAGLLPVPLLDSGQRYPIMVIFAQGDAMVFDVIVTWEDGEGSKEKRLRTSWG
jgi:hypothetical protein